jgi:hypothetical protein
MWWYVAVFIVALVVAYAMTPKPTDAKPRTLSDVTAPTAEDGREVPVLFGTKMLEGPNCVGYGDLKAVAIRR